MNPRDLENRFLEFLAQNKYLSQKALFSIKHLPNGRIVSNRSDFFNVWDIIALKSNHTYLFQICSGTTYNEHVRKINELFPFTTEPFQYIVYYFKPKSKWEFTLHLRTEIGWLLSPVEQLIDNTV